jgi:hypothetical protein
MSTILALAVDLYYNHILCDRARVVAELEADALPPAASYSECSMSHQLIVTSAAVQCTG